jgi:hypothetical protein
MEMDMKARWFDHLVDKVWRSALAKSFSSEVTRMRPWVTAVAAMMRSAGSP